MQILTIYPSCSVHPLLLLLSLTSEYTRRRKEDDMASCLNPGRSEHSCKQNKSKWEKIITYKMQELYSKISNNMWSSIIH